MGLPCEEKLCGIKIKELVDMAEGIVKLIFVHGEGTEVDKTIEYFSNGDYVHVAVALPSLGYIVESLGTLEKDLEGNDIVPGVRKSDINKYDGANVIIKELTVPNIEGSEAEANKLLGTFYGYSDCVDGGVYDRTGIELKGDGELTVDCSECATRVVREGGINVLPNLRADCVTPMRLLNSL